MASGPPRVFVSYSHDSESHVKSIRDLSDRLRHDGIDCQIDQYQMSPDKGWPSWMVDQIEHADFVLVVSTEAYLRRMLGREVPGKGLGATWEGAVITAELYESCGKNSKFIPVLFSEADAEHIPVFLKGATYYDLGGPGGYEELYRRLSNQPRVVQPPLGTIRNLPEEAVKSKASDSSDLPFGEQLVLFTVDGVSQVAPFDEITLDTSLSVVVRPPTSSVSSFFGSLAKDNNRELVGVAYGNTALLGKVVKASQRQMQNGEVWTVEILPDDGDYGTGFMEMSTTGYSADEIAELRARRILLDEKLAASKSGYGLGETMLEVLVQGQSTPMKVERSPLPKLYAGIGGDKALFLSVARLVCVLWLRLGGVVETINSLDLELSGEDLLVQFEGVRSKKYSNVAPTTIVVAGTCKL